jgi:uncharacterized protein (TIGR00299 family) protein
MRIAYFDCLSGISGNMTLGAMLACGLPEQVLVDNLRKLPLQGWSLQAEQVLRRGIQAMYVTVDDHAHDDASVHHAHHHHPHRGLSDILQLIDASDITPRAKQLASAIFRRLGEAEASVHGTTTDQVHFHEVGAVDAIVDIVGTAIGIDVLGIERVIASPLPLGHGWVHCAHGEFPIPAPATAMLVRGVPIAETTIEAELVTPTGAAIITTLAEKFAPLPTMTISRVGYGAGSHDLPRPNVLRLFLGEEVSPHTPDEIVGLETNLDDISGEVTGYLMERLLQAGALDVFYTPIQMKKNRPGVLVRVLCTPQDEATCTDIIFRETTTLGIRRLPFGRVVLPREFHTVETSYGPVKVKTSQWNGIERVEPEYDDCRRLAEEKGVPLLAIYNSVRKMQS